MPKFPNPPLDQIRAADLITEQQAAEQFGIKPGTIRVWIRRGKIEPVPVPGGPRLFHLPTLSNAEKDAWKNGADRPRRGGRLPGWKPCQEKAAA
ncbi:helix-turn-helix domain-containing protein [Streptomyces klenkii]|uniref:Helix-turn-helix domain-containing protein n=1 Tax=Streptomyces klenkii TaxID=1420899 RepID=A0A3B0AR49_9ACTN|nr:helix-turn-helix domain-containing protein [Streptomyces klenkii]RKN61877.1 helix-turn-helix domain-containing protein [Streptomyces klenkii]